MNADGTIYSGMLEHSSRTAKSLREAYDMFLDGSGKGCDLILAGFLLQACFNDGISSVASIGVSSNSEFHLLNALADPAGNFVFLNPDLQDRHRLNEMAANLAGQGFVSRLLMADLTLPTRWPDVINALSIGKVRILGVDAGWAASDPHFWTSLLAFVQAADRAVYIRNCFSYAQPETSINLLRMMPAGIGLEVIAATPHSVWFAAAGPRAIGLRRVLRRSGLFTPAAAPAPAGSADRPVVVSSETAAAFVDISGGFPLFAYQVNRRPSPDANLDEGWSAPEDDGCWTDGSQARLLLAAEPTSGATRLRITGNAWTPPCEAYCEVAFSAGARPGSWATALFVGGEIGEVWIELAPEDLCGGEIIVNVRPAAPGRPSDFGGADTRMLGFKLRSVELFS